MRLETGKSKLENRKWKLGSGNWIVDMGIRNRIEVDTH
jgi:hypothetical protein